MNLIKKHDKLEFMRDTLPQLEQFVDAVRAVPEVNNVKLRLAHKDLYFANILYSRESQRITAILD
jgi:aminoglycoside phosphotransferase (APT) family kinase protein